MSILRYIGTNWNILLQELGRHLAIVGIAMPIAMLVGVPIGIAIVNHKRVARIVIYVASIMMTIPSLALFGFMVIILAPFGAGIGMVPAIVALVIYSFLPVTRNTVVAVRGVDPGMVRAARGMGMTDWQILRKVRLPLAIPIIMAGVRNAAVLGVSVTTIAYLVGARGLGYFIFSGLSRARLDMVIIGAVIVALLGIGTNYGLLLLEEAITPKGVKISRDD
jgi:osmoprotectant transport system permease protein